jgi:large subunit ribosomal protein L44
MAEFRVCNPYLLIHIFINLSLSQAAEDALARVYLTRTPDDFIQLPSSTFPLGLGDVYRTDAEAKVGEYTAPDLVVAEPIYESSGKSRSKPLSQS